jgi:hypothetical protein
VFAFENDGTVAAITSNGITAWTAQATQTSAVPDFNGGLVVANFVPNNYQVLSSIVSLDGITGQPDSTYTPPDSTGLFSNVVVHPDGTIFTVQAPTNGYPNYAYSVVGIDPTSGAQKFSVPLPQPTGSLVWDFDTVAGNSIIAEDGYFYLPYWYSLRNPPPQDGLQGFFLNLLRINSTGESDNIQVAVVPQDANGAALDTIQMNLITNADTGVLMTWSATAIQLLARQGQPTPRDAPPVDTTYGMAVTNGTTANVISTAPLSDQAGVLVPGVQAQDGLFVGSYLDTFGQTDMIAFDAIGNVHWIVPNEQPQKASADGGFIGLSGTKYDQSGNAMGQISNSPTQSWTGSDYLSAGSISSISMPAAELAADGASFWPQTGGNPSANGTAVVQCPCLLQSSGNASNQMFDREADSRAHASVPRAGSGPPGPPFYVILEGDSGINTVDCNLQTGLGCHNVGQEFNLAAATKVTQLSNTGNSASAVRISSVQDFNTQLATSGLIDGGVIYFGHGGAFSINGTLYSTLNPGEGSGFNTNISSLNVAKLSGSNLGPNATVTLNACNAGAGSNSIAQIIANQLKVKVYAYPVGMFFSTNPNATLPGAAPQATPSYMLPLYGAKPICFAPFGLTCGGNPP